MGQNLILNAADHGFNVVAFNRTVSKVDHFLANEAKGELPHELLGRQKLSANCGDWQASPSKAPTPSRSLSASSRSLVG
jgi:6-phosphogluconate dehydrogenase (decarboxylating)